MLAAVGMNAAAPAAAAEVRAFLAVSAVVVPSCRATGAPDGALVSCSSGTRARVTVERSSARSTRDRGTEATAESRHPVTLVTITY